MVVEEGFLEEAAKKDNTYKYFLGRICHQLNSNRFNSFN